MLLLAPCGRSAATKENQTNKRNKLQEKRNAIVARCRIRTFISRSGRLTIVSTKQSLYVLSKIRLLIRYTFIYQSVTHILGKIYKIDIKLSKVYSICVHDLAVLDL